MGDGIAHPELLRSDWRRRAHGCERVRRRRVSPTGVEPVTFGSGDDQPWRPRSTETLVTSHFTGIPYRLQGVRARARKHEEKQKFRALRGRTAEDLYAGFSSGTLALPPLRGLEGHATRRLGRERASGPSRAMRPTSRRPSKQIAGSMPTEVLAGHDRGRICRVARSP
jgi:hypothetical protein